MSAVELSAGTLATLRAALQQHGSREFVGVLGGEDDGDRCRVAVVRLVPNVAAAPDAFTVPAAAFAAAVAAIEADGARWLGFVHSHPGATATLSQQDRQSLWRDCLQLVVGGTTDAPSLAAFHGDAKGFRPLQLAATAAPEDA